AGQPATDNFNVTVTDSHGASVTQNVSFNIIGANDAAVISGTTTGVVLEAGGVNNGSAGTPTATGTLTDTDVDNAANTFTAVPTAAATADGYGRYTMAASGQWTYTLDNSNASVQGLNSGQHLTDTFT